MFGDFFDVLVAEEVIFRFAFAARFQKIVFLSREFWFMHFEPRTACYASSSRHVNIFRGVHLPNLTEAEFASINLIHSRQNMIQKATVVGDDLKLLNNDDIFNFLYFSPGSFKAF